MFAILNVSVTISICYQCLYIIFDSFKFHVEIFDFSFCKYSVKMTLIFNVLGKIIRIHLISEEHDKFYYNWLILVRIYN